MRPLDPWPHSEAGRFHRTIAVMMVALGALLDVVELVRHHRPGELLLLAGTLAVLVAAARRLAHDLRAHPSGFPEPAAAHRLLALGERGDHEIG